MRSGLPYAMAAGFVSVPGLAAGGNATIVAMFRSGRFLATPYVRVYPDNSNLTPVLNSFCATQCEIVGVNRGNACTGGQVATQMSASGAPAQRRASRIFE